MRHQMYKRDHVVDHQTRNSVNTCIAALVFAIIVTMAHAQTSCWSKSFVYDATPTANNPLRGFMPYGTYPCGGGDGDAQPVPILIHFHTL